MTKRLPPIPERAPIPSGPTPLLVASKIMKHYGGVVALRDAQLEIREGEVHVLMGENGAGKSTLAKVLAGVVRPDSGTVLFRGQPVDIRTPLDAYQLGIGIVFQELDLFPHLTIAENIVIGQAGLDRRPFVSFRAMERFCQPILDQVGLNVSPSTVLSSLSLGQMQLVAIARGLSMNARLILMDEPTSALGEHDVERLFALIRKLTAEGISILYVSHKMQEIFQIADRLTVMRDGCFIGTRNVKETNMREIITMMVGRELADAAPRQSRTGEKVRMSVRGLTTSRLSDISFELRAGEVLGLAGLVGAGRSELGAALFGLDRIVSGQIELNGHAYHPKNVRHAVSCGFGLVPEDRKGQGLMMHMSVKENCTISSLPKLSTGGFINRRRELTTTKTVLQRSRTKTHSYDSPVNSLSGGNQQKVLLSRWLQVDPDVLFLDDPTRGIDIGAKRDIYAMIEELAAANKGVLWVSSELPELLLNCDRILVLHEGHLAGTLQARGATQEQIMALAARSC